MNKIQKTEIVNNLNKTYQPSRKVLYIVGWLILITIIASYGFIGYQQFNAAAEKTLSEQRIENQYVAFLIEIYNKIKTNYWQSITDKELTNLYLQALNKLEYKPAVTVNDKLGLAASLGQIFSTIDSASEKEKLAADIANIVLYNLQPLGRSGLYTEEKEQALWDNVKNIDRSTDLYQEIGVDKEAENDEIKQAAEEAKQKLAQVIKDPEQPAEAKQEAEQKLAKVTRAEQTLTQPTQRKNYDQYGTEATVYGEIINGNILHLQIKKISPLTFTEFQEVANHFDQFDELNTLVLDLRDNIGGSVDLLPYFLGPFIGNDEYAYELFHQGEYIPYKTKVGWLPSLVRYKNVVILQNEKGQSSAELMAVVLKKYNVGVLVGTNTKGWGTIEAVYDIQNQISDNQTYKMFLVHSITLRQDGQPIEGRGVDPLININSDNWTDQLYIYTNNRKLVEVIQNLISK